MSKPIWDWNIAGRLKLLLALVLVFSLVIVAPLAYIGSEGVAADEHGVVVDRSGEVQRIVGPGPHFAIPYFQRIDTVPHRYDEERVTTIGTSDNNSVTIHYEIQHSVSKEDIQVFYDRYGAHTSDYKYRPPHDPKIRNCVIDEFVAFGDTHNQSEFVSNHKELRDNADTECGSETVRVVVTQMRFDNTGTSSL